MGDDKKFSYEKELWEGVDKVNARYEEGEKTMREMEKFFDSRASLESDFARKLQSTCIKPSGTQEGRSFGAAWQACRQNNENIAKSHAVLGQTLTTIVNDLTAFRKEHCKQKDQHNTTISTLKRELARGSDSVKRAKQSYFQKSEASEVASALYTKSQSDASVNPKTLSKYSASAIKSKKEADQADSAYQQNVQEFQTFQLKYEESMKNTLAEFQRMEEKRLVFLKEVLDKVIQAQETLNSELENHQISFKTAVSQINGNGDVQNFIAENKTGVAPARPTEYEPFGQPAKSQSAGTTTTKSKKLSKSSARKSVSGAIAPLVHNNHSSSASVHTSTQSSTPSYNHSPSVSSSVPTPTVNSTPQTHEKETYAKALYDYQAQDDTELSFDVDEVITVTKQDNSGWWEGSIHGKTGIFPANYCQIVDKKPVSSAPTKQPPSRAPAAQPNVKKCQVKFEFIGESTDELSIYEGEIITITETADGWYSGMNEKGESGMFPANYVVLL